jgi:hypothetical protein
MPILPAPIMVLLTPFMPLFRTPTWVKAQILLVGSILAPGKRTVTAALRVMGLADQEDFAKYHHVLNRAVWSALSVGQMLLRVLLDYLDDGEGVLVFGIDETIERRWGKRIRARGIYRDPVRSSHSHFVKTSGLRWVSLMWLVSIPWVQRVWALPILTALAPSARYYQQRERPAKKLTDWARQLILPLRRWLPDRRLVIVTDRSYAALDLLHACQTLVNPVTLITRLRLDAALYASAPPRRSGQIGRPRRKGERLPPLRQRLADPETVWTQVTVRWYNGTQRTFDIATDTAVWYHTGKAPVPIRWVLIRDPLGQFDPQALLCTDPTVAPVQLIEWFVRRWQMEVTFQEARAHLGVETQRQWSDLAIARTTPALLGLFSWVTLAAHVLHPDHAIPVRRAAWYPKPLPTFSDAIALVRRHLWPCSPTFCMSPSDPDIVKVPSSWLNMLVDTLSYAA